MILQEKQLNSYQFNNSKKNPSVLNHLQTQHFFRPKNNFVQIYTKTQKKEKNKKQNTLYSINKDKVSK